MASFFYTSDSERMCKLYVFSSYFINRNVDIYFRIIVERCWEIT